MQKWIAGLAAAVIALPAWAHEDGDELPPWRQWHPKFYTAPEPAPNAPRLDEFLDECVDQQSATQDLLIGMIDLLMGENTCTTKKRPEEQEVQLPSVHVAGGLSMPIVEGDRQRFNIG